MAANLDGIYTAYFTGATGNSIGMFVFLGGVITGADVGGGRYDGDYSLSDNGERVRGNVKFSLPVGNSTITGFAAETTPIIVEMTLDLPAEFNRHDVHRIETPLGPINAKFEKIRGF